MLKKYTDWYQAKSNTLIGRLVFMILVIIFATFSINRITGQGILTNIDFLMFIAAMYLSIWLLDKYVRQTLFQGAIAFIVSFVLLTLRRFQMGVWTNYHGRTTENPLLSRF